MPTGAGSVADDVLVALAPQLQALAAREANRAAAEAEANITRKIYVGTAVSLGLGLVLGWVLYGRKKRR